MNQFLKEASDYDKQSMHSKSKPEEGTTNLAAKKGLTNMPPVKSQMKSATKKMP